MIEGYRLSKLPKYGKTFVAAFALLLIGVVLWMVFLGAMESGMIGTSDELAGSDIIQEGAHQGEVEIPEEEAIEPLIEDSELVTAPNWSDSGEQRVITEADTSAFLDTEPAVPFRDAFESNLEWSMEHFASELLLFFAAGLLFLFTGYSDRLKRFLYIWLGILIFVHAIGMAGMGFCWPANAIMYVVGPLILLTFLVMAVMILKDLGRN